MRTKRVITTKAVYFGTCQICGALQKLPKGRLSKHGYTKEWGFFNGMCAGAENKPFELSKDLIEGIIIAVKTQIQNLELEITKVQSDTSNVVPFREYRSGNGLVRSGYYWTTATVTEENGSLTITLADGKKFPGSRYGYYKLDSALDRLRLRRVEDIKATIKQRREYIQWQEGRIRDWVARPGELIPVSPGA